MTTPLRVDKAIQAMLHARLSHLKWARFQARRVRKVRHVGSATFHRKWVKIYDEVIGLLRAHRRVR